ncbi:hypothetical protein MLD38_030600 [Melastoma candidum]|uniref:Uncharacterized protein n=1 Tax=Melastoma candidum TaxID=119954 RepID=A0ACB9MLP0_9MYRT|nr:hypothetical protein MLD38_030600 [Melastoma candidum]
MAGETKSAAGRGGGGGFTLTPHKISICVLLQQYASPHQLDVHLRFPSVAHHNRLGMFLLSLTKSCDGIFEPKLPELVHKLKEMGGSSMDWLADHLISSVSAMTLVDDLFIFMSHIRGLLPVPDGGGSDYDQIVLEPSSNLGLFLRRCILTFNILSFEGVCHLVKNIDTYSKDAVSSPQAHDRCLDGSEIHLGEVPGYEKMELENIVLKNVLEEMEAKKKDGGNIPFHLHLPMPLYSLVEDTGILSHPNYKQVIEEDQARFSGNPQNSSVDDGSFLRSGWQVQGYMLKQAEAMEKSGSSFSLHSLDLLLRQLENLLPELHRVHFLRYLNNLYHNDYPSSLENLHKYFDYSAGLEGLDFISPLSGGNSYGRYEIALLSLGLLHFHFGHPKQAIEVFTEAVHASHLHKDDTCLAYTLAALCNLLSETGMSSTSGVLGSSQSSAAATGASLSVHQQLSVFLIGSLKKSESLKLKQLEASIHLVMARFYMAHVQRPMLSFGPKTSIELKTCPIKVYKELRASSLIISEFDAEGSLKAIDGPLSSIWINHPQSRHFRSAFQEEDETRNQSSDFGFFAQPSTLPGSVSRLAGSSYLIRATAWEMYGSSHLARVNSLIYTTCFADSSSSAEAALAYGKLIQHLAVFKGYKAAFDALKKIEDQFLSVSKSHMQILKLQLLHERALHRGQLKLAQKVCDELGVLASPVEGVDMDLKTEASFRRARTLLAAKQFHEAADVAHSLFCMCYKFNLLVQDASVLLLIAEIHKKSGNAVLGIPYALASLSYCQSFNLDLLKASATLTLAELWLSFGSTHAKRALILVQSALPMILGHGGLELRARVLITEVKCYLYDTSFSVLENSEIILDSLREATDELEVLEYHELASEAFYLTALVYNKLGQVEEREQAASSFEKHISALQNPLNECDTFV